MEAFGYGGCHFCVDSKRVIKSDDIEFNFHVIQIFEGDRVIKITKDQASDNESRSGKHFAL